MSHRIVKQKDGNYAVYSSITDSLVCWNATRDELIEYYLEIEKERIQKRIDDVKEYDEEEINEVIEDVCRCHKKDSDERNDLHSAFGEFDDDKFKHWSEDEE